MNCQLNDYLLCIVTNCPNLKRLHVIISKHRRLTFWPLFNIVCYYSSYKMEHTLSILASPKGAQTRIYYRTCFFIQLRTRLYNVYNFCMNVNIYSARRRAKRNRCYSKINFIPIISSRYGTRNWHVLLKLTRINAYLLMIVPNAGKSVSTYLLPPLKI